MTIKSIETRLGDRRVDQADQRAAMFARISRQAILGFVALGGLLVLASPVFSNVVTFSPFWIYGVVLTAAAILGFALERMEKTKWVTILIYITLFDIGIGLVSLIGDILGVSSRMVPSYKMSAFQSRGIAPHPLLQVALTPNYAHNGIEHTEQATRVVQDVFATQPEQARTNVALIGGSSTYDISLRQGRTWPEVLQQHLPQYRFWNYGVPSFTTVSHIIQTAWYLPEIDAKCAIYYIGWNDIRNANLPNTDPAYADFQQQQFRDYGRQTIDNSITPTIEAISSLIRYYTLLPVTPNYFGTVEPKLEFDETLAGYYRRNVETLIGINKQRGVKVGFIGQLLNYPLLKQQPKGQRAFVAPGVEDRHIPEIMDYFNAVLATAAAKNNVPFLQPAQNWLESEDYTDFGHFSPSGARKFASRVKNFIDETCKP